VDDPRGAIIYLYVGPSGDPESAIGETGKILKGAARDCGVSVLPILVVVLYDANGTLGQALAERSVLEDISQTDAAKFGNLVGAHKDKLLRTIREQIDSMIKERNYATGLKDGTTAQRLSQVGTELFSRIYKNPVPFPFDGFSTAKGNAADTSHELTRELLYSKLDYDSIMAKPIKTKNRAISVLKDSWGIFAKNGDILKRPTDPVVRSFTERLDDCLSKDGRINAFSALGDMCRPPFGANAASAGLLLGTYVAPRAKKLIVVKNGQQLSFAEWIDTGIFRGKFIDFFALRDTDFVSAGDAPEWEALLEDWGQCSDHLSKKSCLQRANELRRRLPVPPDMVYREERLRDQASDSVRALDGMEGEVDKALSKIERGIERRDVGTISWGAADIKKTIDRMNQESPQWTEAQIKECQPPLERGRQAVVHFFGDWLPRQNPANDLPSEVAEFKNRMLKLIGPNLKKLGLTKECEKLEEHTQRVVRNAETVADAQQLLRDVRSWLDAHADVLRMGRIAEIRGLRDVGSGYSKKLQGMGERIQLPDIIEVRTQLSDFLNQLKNTEAEIKKRADHIWRTKIRGEEDIAPLIDEVEALIGVYENVQSDLEDLQLMRRALRLYQKSYDRLSDENLSWAEFEKLVEEVQQELAKAFEDEELPWSYDETVNGLVQVISKNRRESSTRWIDAMEAETEDTSAMTADEANRLHARATKLPAVITEPHAKRAAVVVKKLEARLEYLTIDWLVEKFKELPLKARGEFLHRVQELTG
jgi:hypothetical protein